MSMCSAREACWSLLMEKSRIQKYLTVGFWRRKNQYMNKRSTRIEMRGWLWKLGKFCAR